MRVASTLVHYDMAEVAALKSFIVKASGPYISEKSHLF
jgi:hypothetical protein